MTEFTPNQPILAGPTVVRIHWTLGTDLLRAVCHCGVERDFDEPIALWEWLLAHPVGHRPAFDSSPPRVPAGVPAFAQ